MRKLHLIILSLIITFSLTSCIDLIEEVTVNKNLSGHYELRLEASSFGSMMNGQIDLPGMRNLNEKVNLLKLQEGISNVRKNIQPKNMQFKITFDFKNEKALNKAMYQLAEIEPNMFVKKFLKIKKHKIIRPNLSPYLQKLIEDQNLLDQIPSTDLLSYINYKFIVNTPSDIRGVKGNNTMVQSNNKTVITSISFKDLIVNKENVYLKIRL